MEQRKVTTSDKSSEKLNRASLAFTRGVPRFTTNTTWKKKNSETHRLTCYNKRSAGYAFSLRESHPDGDGDQSSEGRDDDESDPQGLAKGQELDDFRYAGVVSFIGPVVTTAQDTFTSICQRGREGGRGCLSRVV